MLESDYIVDPSDAMIVAMPVIIKARTDAAGKRFIEVQASSEDVDDEGDVIAQKALMDSAEHFVKNGHLDINHYSELHARLNLPGSPSDWIIGHPTEVKDIGNGRTSIVGEIRRGAEKAEAFWKSMTSDPPVRWRASIYGFPPADGFTDCRKDTCVSGAQRFHITKMRWESTALTCSPINSSLTGFARVITAKAYVEAFRALSRARPSFASTQGARGDQMPNQNTLPPYVETHPVPDPREFSFPSDGEDIPPPQVSLSEPPSSALPALGAATQPAPASFIQRPRCIADAVGQHAHHMSRECPHCTKPNTTLGFKNHFSSCCGMSESEAEVWAHALQHWLLLDRRRI